MSNDSISKTLLVAFLLCIVCSALVSTAAVKLKPLQEKNKALSVKQNILMAAGLKGDTVDELFKKIDMKVVDLATGEFDDSVKPDEYDQVEAAKDPLRNLTIPKIEDVAGIKQRAKKALVYLVHEEGKLQTIILPVYGKGLWSTMRAFLALEGDVDTVKSFIFYEHGETPGLGGEVDNPLWKQQWPGKKMYGENGRLAVEVLKGKVNLDRPQAIHQVDGLAGATLTTRGINNIMYYWLGGHGYGKFVAKFKNSQLMDK